MTLTFALLNIVDNTQACRNPAHNAVLRIILPLVFLLIKKIKEIVMKNLVKVLSVFIFLFSGLSFAGTTIVDVWQCKLKEGKTMKDAGIVNEKWVKYMNTHVKSSGINSYDLAPKVGNNEGFMYVDVYPDLETWAASDDVMKKTKEGKALQKELSAVAKCSSNSLYSSTKH